MIIIIVRLSKLGLGEVRGLPQQVMFWRMRVCFGFLQNTTC